MGGGVCMAESLHCSPKAITTLLIGHTLIQNKIDKRHCGGADSLAVQWLGL